MKSIHLVVLIVIFHLVALLSVFDIYFRSPIVYGMDQHKASERVREIEGTKQTEMKPEAPAKRLILFSIDGCRADRFFLAEPKFLTEKIKKQGRYGISHTRVPTETRPGHVAMCAGFWEDLSAVTRGWQENPFEFDSVFNQSFSSFAFGGPDAIEIFFKKNQKRNLTTFAFTGDDEHFTGPLDTLDIWVFDHADELLKNATWNNSLLTQMESDKVIIFLHLLGVDLEGHAHLPLSQEYTDHIRRVDARIQKFVEAIEDFYGHDNRTAFIVTADHGMSDRGAHGDGDPMCTQTPYVVWGAGFSGPVPLAQSPSLSSPNPQIFDTRVFDWKLENFLMKDINQADIAPLISAVLDLPFPMHSVGTLPIDLLDTSPQFRTSALIANFDQMYSQLKMKSSIKQKNSLSFLFRPFKPLDPSFVDSEINTVISLAGEGKFDLANQKVLNLIQLALEGLHYFQTYDWFFLRSIVTLGYVGSILSAITLALTKTKPTTNSQNHSFFTLSSILVETFVFIVSLSVFALLFVQHSPIQYYLYSIFPLLFWREILHNLSFWKHLLSHFFRNFFRNSILLLFVLGLLQLIVFGYFKRIVFSLAFLFLILIPFIFSTSNTKNKMTARFKALWILSCLIMSVFTALPIIKGVVIDIISIAGVIVVSFLVFSLLLNFTSFISILRSPSEISLWKGSKIHFLTAVLQLVLVALSFVSAIWTSLIFSKGGGLSQTNMILNWSILASSIPLIFFASPDYYHRLTSIFIGLLPGFVLLSVSYEPIFYVFLCFSMFLSMKLICQLQTNQKEDQNQKNQKNFHKQEKENQKNFHKQERENEKNLLPLNVQLLSIISLFFIFWFNISIFGAGNVASVSSFDLSATFRFETRFRPFTMGALLAWKLFVPFIPVLLTFEIVAKFLQISLMQVVLFVFALADFPAIQFFFFVRDSGSWLEIGMSISHFIIFDLFFLSIFILLLVSKIFTFKINVPFYNSFNKKD
ncbi:phosphatidylinositol glycan class n [Anaeramoeba ignava]|uniref:GPI ethanolamine phosphate transferase 1 n=1 Tax=Anaeramoeba ignava TaxID=1746090 RepID=A0A9Q0LR03_ANAIG|nr:phosphatidylinositol glycan class n [Anaeramoeba ignava]